MSRHYVIQDWSNSATWSGEMIGDRLSKSKGHHFLKNGQANVNLYAGDEEDYLKKKSKVSIKDRILPQFKRLQTLREQMVDLEQEYKTTEMSCDEYSMLRDVIVCKIARAEILYKKAVSVKPLSNDYQDFHEETEEVEQVLYTTNHASDTRHTNTWIDDLPDSNSLKRPIKIVCTLVKGLVRFTSATKRYLKTLQEV